MRRCTGIPKCASWRGQGDADSPPYWMQGPIANQHAPMLVSNGLSCCRSDSVPRAFAAGIHLDAEREAALFTRLHRTDSDQAPGNFLATFIADGQHHRIFP